MKKRSSYKFPVEQFPALRVVLIYIAGILCSQLFRTDQITLICIFIGIVATYFIFETLSGKTVSIRLSRISTLLYCLIIFAAGFTINSIASKKNQTAVEMLISESEWAEIHVSGNVLLISKNSSGDKRLDLAVTSTKLSGFTSDMKFKSRILWDNELPVELGDQIEISGIVIPVSEPRNPTQFNYKAFLESRNIHTQIRADSVIQINPDSSFFSWMSVRKKALKLVDQNFDPETAPVAKALLLGYKNELEGNTKQAFARAGLSHIMAVSGLHVGLIIAPFWLIIPYFWTKKNGTKIGLALLILILVFYAGLTGFSVSVLRASVMAVLLTYGKLFSKSSDSLNLMGVAALVILLIDPSQLFEIGFQLSFSAVLIILLVLPVIQNAIPYWVRIKWYGTPIMVIIISLVVQLGLYPLQAFYFGEVSLISPLANALFVPLLSIIVPLSLLALIISSVIPALGFFINYPSLVFLATLNDFVSFSSQLSQSWFEVQKPGISIFLFWTSFVLMIGSWRNPNIKWKLMAISLFLLFFIPLDSVLTKFEPPKLTITLFDVGQGDATLLQTPNGKNILIDAGIWSPGSNSGKQVLLPFFKENNIQKLDAVFLSHPHADHIGGIKDLLNEIDIDTIYNSGFEYESNLYRDYINLANSKDIPVVTLNAGTTIDIDESLLILVLGPEKGKFNNDPNQHSLVLNIIHGENEFLFTGDAGEDQERRLVENYGHLLDTDFLKVGHHGSKTSSELFFLKEVTPEIAVVSVAERNRFGHPHPEAVERLESTRSNIYYTSRDRALIFESDGKSIKRVKWY
ncbi:MAG: DNA internalization-related competence protein ComEC/Rec2 [Balneola sp.]|nr:DNA internalization-related competence protein ComEC/Rec2 [Balneola sp.]MBO6712590.1 DNA internalization-related competence protein ComEC/Rec2 [Balneola sp.]MBO6870589.1 DNA internalization-related competence protein ComEC/Rec2 [Balneola sp.]